MTITFNNYTLEISNKLVSYEDVKYWGYDDEFFIVFRKDSQDLMESIPMNKTQYTEIDLQIKEKIKNLIEQGEFQSSN